MMLHSPPDSITVLFLATRCSRLGAEIRSGFSAAALAGLCAAMLSSTLPGASQAQDWGGELDHGPSYSTNAQAGQGGSGSPPGWSLRGGIGFTADPTSFLLNFEAPYAFDRWVSAGPMLQLGLDDDHTIVAPTLNVSVTIPDLPGEDFDRLHPYGMIGIGFAYIENDNRGRSGKDDTGFLINFGFGLEFEVSENLFIGSQMMFNFLPVKTVGEHFFYSWQVGGVRIAF